jgi:predicted phosphodiesterase
MKLAILADIHGNANALMAVMEDLQKRKLDQAILLGDLYVKGPEPQTVFRLLQELPQLHTIKGNTEGWFWEGHLDRRRKELVAYVEHAFPAAREEIQRMADPKTVTLEGHSIYLTHHYRALDMGKHSAILSAHTHIPAIEENYSSKGTGAAHYNPGSVGMPYDQDKRSSYGILDLGDRLHFEIVRVPYDIEKEIDTVKRVNLPYAENYLKQIGRLKVEDL